jgi:hypothetical protein
MVLSEIRKYRIASALSSPSTRNGNHRGGGPLTCAFVAARNRRSLDAEREGWILRDRTDRDANCRRLILAMMTRMARRTHGYARFCALKQNCRRLRCSQTEAP